MRQTPEEYNAMIRAYHRMTHQVVQSYRKEHSLGDERIYARAVGDECFMLLPGGNGKEEECHAMRLAVRLKQGWINSEFGKRLAQAHALGLLPRVDLRVGVGCGEVVFDEDVWTGASTPEGTMISEAKRIETAAGDLALDTLILTKLDIKEAAEQAGLGVVFGGLAHLQAKGFVGGTHQVPVYPVLSWAEFREVQDLLVPTPASATDHFNRAMALQRSSSLPEAVAAYEQALALQPAFGDAWNNLGVALFTSGRLPEAIRAYQEALAIDQHDAVAWYNLGLAHKGLRQWDQAAACYRRAIQEREGYPQAWNELASAYVEQGDMQQGLWALREAERLAPGFNDTLYNRACVLALMGEPQTAFAELRRLFDLDPTYRNLADQDPELALVRELPEYGEARKR